MTKVSPTPAYDVISDPVTGKASRSYLEFFDDLARGDQGQTWTPTFTGLTAVGTPTITGTFYQVGRLAYFRVDIVPGTSTSSTLGTTYINNFPLVIAGNAVCNAVTGAPSAALGMVDATNQRIYMPTWAGITTKVTAVGWVEAS